MEETAAKMPNRKKALVDPDAVPLSPQEKAADNSLGVWAQPSMMSADQITELKGHSFYVMARLRNVDTAQAAMMLVRGFSITEAKARELLKRWAKQSDEIAEGADEKWLRTEMVALYEASRARGMLLNALAMDMPSQEILTEARTESALQMKVGQRIVELTKQIGDTVDDDAAQKKVAPAIDALMETAKRLENSRSSVEMTFKVSGGGNG